LYINSCAFTSGGTPFGSCNVTTQFLTFGFSSIKTTPRSCFEVSPGIVISDVKETVAITWALYQKPNTSLYGNGFDSGNNIYYGLFANERDKNSTTIKLGIASGTTVVAFQVESTSLLGQPPVASYSVLSATSAPNMQEAVIDYLNNSVPFPDQTQVFHPPPGRYLYGTLALQAASITVQSTTQELVFGWTDIIGAVGGVFSLVVSVKIFLNGDGSDPAEARGFITRVFFSTDFTTDAVDSSNKSGAKLNSELEELRRRAVYNNSNDPNRSAAVSTSVP